MGPGRGLSPWLRIVLLALPLACTDESVLLEGTWHGETTQYLQVTFALTQIGDSLQGSGSTLLAAPINEHITSQVHGWRHGDTVFIHGVNLAPSAGGGFVIQFGGRLMGSTLVGEYGAMHLPPDTIVLTRIGLAF